MGRKKSALLDVVPALVEGYNNGISAKELGRIYGAAPSTVIARLQEVGVPIRRRPRKTEEGE